MTSSSSSKTMWNRLSERPVFLGWCVVFAVLGYSLIMTSVSVFMGSILDVYWQAANVWFCLLAILIGTGFLVAAVAVAAKANRIGLEEEVRASKI